MTDLKMALEGIVKGELRQLSAVLSANHSELLESAANLSNLIISRSTLISVLTGWRSGIYTPEAVQTWASLVRRGYASKNSNCALRPIAIPYNANDEVLIVEILGRLDEIGDKIDGVIDYKEREEMLRILGA